ncbi:MAG: mycofactocin system-associated heme/flavin dehydrogenase [Acidimicrobiia bacterium]|nr:mycofactocin system-associated heme/flavin dehydrogenase [Acidimicrobiia bacterium]
MANKWFETVAVAQRRAEKRVPSSVYNAIIGGAEKGLSLASNQRSFDDLGFAPHVAGLPAERSMATRVMGLDLSMPVIISPTGVQAVHPEGEVAVARAATNRGLPMGLSSFASRSMEEVVAANPNTLFQMYWSGGRDVMVQRLERARAAGVKGIILTLDWTFSNGRDWGSPFIPEKMNLRTMIKLSPQALSRPRWFWSYLRLLDIPDLTTPNMAAPGAAPPTFFGAYYEWMTMPPPSWDDIAWLRSQWDGPFMVKGVCRVDDAKRVRDLGATALSVSNHGGNNLDGTPSPIRALPAIAEAVGSEVEVVLDGGVRRGSDVVKAVALGARAVMIGRAYLWGLAVNGQAGVENVLDILRGGIDACMLGLAKSDISELGPDDLVIPPGFLVTLGAD